MKLDFENTVIVSDLDGTFFGERSSILENNVEAIRRFTSRGGTFTFASGRDIRVLERVFPEAGEIANAPAVLCGGSYLYDFKTREVFDENSMDQADTERIAEIVFREFPRVGLSVHTLKGLYCPAFSDRMAKIMARYMDIVFQVPFSEFRDLHWHKAMFNSYDTELIQGIFRLSETLDLGNLILTTSAPNIAEFLPKEAGKGPKVAKLRELCGKDKTVICVGNAENDVEMLEAADVAASPANSIDRVKEISQFHLCDHKDGCIADLIDQLCNSKEN